MKCFLWKGRKNEVTVNFSNDHSLLPQILCKATLFKGITARPGTVVFAGDAVPRAALIRRLRSNNAHAYNGFLANADFSGVNRGGAQGRIIGVNTVRTAPNIAAIG
jgi:hypothetical protein